MRLDDDIRNFFTLSTPGFRRVFCEFRCLSKSFWVSLPFHNWNVQKKKCAKKKSTCSYHLTFTYVIITLDSSCCRSVTRSINNQLILIVAIAFDTVTNTVALIARYSCSIEKHKRRTDPLPSRKLQFVQETRFDSHLAESQCDNASVVFGNSRYPTEDAKTTLVSCHVLYHRWELYNCHTRHLLYRTHNRWIHRGT